MLSSIDHISGFKNRVTGVINEDAELVQHSKHQESYSSPLNVFGNYTGVESTQTVSRPPKKVVETNFTVSDDEAWIVVSDKSFVKLFLMHVDPLMTLKTKSDFNSILKKFRDDLVENLAKLYKPYGFTRKRKTTLEQMQERIRSDNFDEYCFAYMSKLLEKNIYISTEGERKKQTYVFADDKPWILFHIRANGSVNKYATEVATLADCQNIKN